MLVLFLIFASFFVGNVSAVVYPVCTGFNADVKHFRSESIKDVVYSYTFDININLNKDFVDKNEIIISNYSYWSFNEAVYHRGNSSYICDTLTNIPCMEWIPSNITFTSQALPFQQYYLYYYAQIDSTSSRRDSFGLMFDKKLMVIATDNSEYTSILTDDNKCQHKSVHDYKTITLCCNNFIPVNLPDKYDNTCLEYNTKATISLNSNNLINFEATYVSVPNQLKVDGNQFSTTFYDDYYFRVISLQDITTCIKGSNNPGCYLYEYYNFAYDFVLIPMKYQNAAHLSYDDYGIIVSKLRIVNTIPLKENFEPFTKDDPCWKPPNSIPFANNSMTADISFCCTSFGPPPILPTGNYPSSYSPFNPFTANNYSTTKTSLNNPSTTSNSSNFVPDYFQFLFITVIIFFLTI